MAFRQRAPAISSRIADRILLSFPPPKLLLIELFSSLLPSPSPLLYPLVHPSLRGDSLPLSPYFLAPSSLHPLSPPPPPISPPCLETGAHFSGGALPQDDGERVDVRLPRVGRARQDLRRHPLVGTQLPCGPSMCLIHVPLPRARTPKTRPCRLV